jgi:hypothetical protein
MLVQRLRHFFKRLVHLPVEFDFVIKGTQDFGNALLQGEWG